MSSDDSPPPRRPGAFAPLDVVLDALDGLGSLVTLTAETVVWLFRPPFRVGQVLLAMEFLGVGSLFIVALTGTFSGMVLALQTVNSLRRFQSEGLVGGIVALSLTREISPVFTGIMVTARVGSACCNSASVASGFTVISATRRTSWSRDSARPRNLVCFHGAIDPVSRRRCASR